MEAERRLAEVEKLERRKRRENKTKLLQPFKQFGEVTSSDYLCEVNRRKLPKRAKAKSDFKT